MEACDRSLSRLLSQYPRGHITNADDDAREGRRTSLIPAPLLNPAPGAVLVAQPCRDLSNCIGLSGEGGDEGFELGLVIGVAEAPGPEGRKGLRRIAQDRGDGRADVARLEISTKQDDPLGAVLDDRPEASLARTPVGLGLSARGDVLNGEQRQAPGPICGAEGCATKRTTSGRQLQKAPGDRAPDR